MGKRDSLIPSLVSLLAKAKPLHDWTRANAAEVNVHRSLTRVRREEPDSRRHQTKVDAIIKNHDTLNKFFNDLGFPSLPKDHALIRHWEHQISQVRKQEQRMTTQGKRRRPAKQNGGRRNTESTFRHNVKDEHSGSS